MRSILSSLFLVVSACGIDVSVAKHDQDDDGDGYTVAVDCDDAHAAVNPDATEICDGLDNDCDGTVDDDATDASTFFADGDADGAGDLDNATAACEQPAGFVTDSADCDDTDASAYPGNTELCDDTDNDCDGAVDEDATDVTRLYEDADGDGYGDPGLPLDSCDPVAGYVEDGTDCDDADDAIHPDAAEPCTDPVDYNCDGSTGYADADGDGTAACEDCDDADPARSPTLVERCDDANLDEDCDGTADDHDGTATGQSTWYRDVDADTYGDAVTTLSACDTPVGYVATSTDCDDGEASINPAASEVCDSVDNDCDALIDDADPSISGTTSWYTDGDGDSYGAGVALYACFQPSGTVTNNDDCNDGSTAISPAGIEICDPANTDEDCDTLADDSDSSAVGKTPGYRDADSDTYGASTSTTSACDLPAGYVANSTDCNDGNATINPAATEICDPADTDEDCDTLADDSDSAASGKSTWYRDADSDTYGTSTSTMSACDLPSGYVANSTDCNDGSATISPAASEICDPANTDEDCDTLADDSDSAASGKSTWYRDADSDTYGTSSSTRAACDLPSGYVTDDTDCEDGDAAVNPGEPEICANGIDDDCDVSIDEGCGLSGILSAADADATVYGESRSDQFGASVSGGFDFDEDGNEDFVVGAPSDDDGAAAGGAVYLYTGDVTPGSNLATDDDYFKLYGTTFYGDAGLEVWAIPDLDRDGDDELMAIGNGTSTLNLVLGPSARGTNPLSSAATATVTPCDEVAFAGHSDSLTGNDDWMCGWSYDASSTGKVTVYSGQSTVVGTLVGESIEDYAGYALAGGEDVDGDGYDDYLIGAIDDDDAGSNAGAAYVVYAPVSPSVTTSLSSADVKLTGDVAADAFGSTARLGDMDGDGYADVLVGAALNSASASRAGAIYVFDTPLGASIPASAAAAVIYGAAVDDELGNAAVSFMSVGDADGDGELDLLVGAARNDAIGTSSGQAWLFYGPVSGSYDLGAGAAYDAAFQGAAAGDYFGQSGTLASDLDDDGLDDIVIGAPYGDGGASTNEGAVYVFYGK